MPADKLAHVQRVLHGWNQGRPVAPVPLPEAATIAAAEGGYDLQAYRFEAAAEQLRAPRVVRVGLVQNACPAPTTAPFAEQRQVGAGSARVDEPQGGAIKHNDARPG